MESYRSGHNEPDSKSGSPKGLEGSNPSLSAQSRMILYHAAFLYHGFEEEFFLKERFLMFFLSGIPAERNAQTKK